MLGEQGTEQFKIEVRVDDKVVYNKPIHDPFIRSKTVIGLSRWQLVKAMFSKQFQIKVETHIDGKEGVIRAIMMLDTEALERETTAMLQARKQSRESSTTKGYVSNQHHG